MLRSVSEPFHNAPKMFKPFSKAFNSHPRSLESQTLARAKITVPLLEQNGVDRCKSSFMRASYFFPLRSKEPTTVCQQEQRNLSKREIEREGERNWRAIRNPRKQKHTGTTSFTSFSFRSSLYPLGRGTFRNIYPVALHSIENLVSLFCNRLLRLVTSLSVHLLNSHDPRDR